MTLIFLCCTNTLPYLLIIAVCLKPFDRELQITYVWSSNSCMLLHSIFAPDHWRDVGMGTSKVCQIFSFYPQFSINEHIKWLGLLWYCKFPCNQWSGMGMEPPVVRTCVVSRHEGTKRGTDNVKICFTMPNCILLGSGMWVWAPRKF